MLQIKELDNGYLEVSSTTGLVDIGEGAVKAIICTKDEVEYITEEEMRGSYKD